MKISKLIPILAILVAAIVLAITFYMHNSMPDGPASTFAPPETGTDEPAPPWGIGVEIVTPIA